MFTPILLEKSWVALPAVGRNLRVHPVTGVWGRFDTPIDPWGGVMQARIGDAHADLDGRGYGVRYESSAIHPVELALLHGWAGAQDVKGLLRSYRHWAPFGVLLRDRSAGTVRARRARGPIWEYSLGQDDLAHVRIGVRHATEALVAAGAREIRSAQEAPVIWRPASGEPIGSFLAKVDAAGYGACQTIYGSYHQMGSARIGSDRKTSVVDEECRVHGVPGLYVMDASCFPTASGVNPMLSIEAIAHRASRALAARFATART
jgi:choline dehydrogenase-like flavoprotein